MNTMQVKGALSHWVRLFLPKELLFPHWGSGALGAREQRALPRVGTVISSSHTEWAAKQQLQKAGAWSRAEHQSWVPQGLYRLCELRKPRGPGK